MASISACPKVTVMMPVYNGARYLHEAIISILEQSFTDFELLIIDDGSTDNSVEIVNSFSDPRIRQVYNDQNIGVSRTLNKGIDLARGEFIARMDADDISLPRRLEIQVNKFLISPDATVVATWVTLINAAGGDIGVWGCDRSASTCAEIYRMLPRLNCLAHPSVMMRKEILARYRYRDTNVHAQDYDLWLRLAADNFRIEKIKDSLLKYRVHSDSISALSNAASYGIKDIRVKSKYLLYQLGKKNGLNLFDTRVAFYLFLDVFKFSAAKFNFKVRFLIRKILLTVGWLFSFFSFTQSESNLFFFFPFYCIGGAERVHAGIVSAVLDQKPWVIITNPSKVTNTREVFKKNGRLVEISTLVKTVVGRIICLGYFSGMINRSAKATVFGANTPFFYELLPCLTPEVKAIDLIHAFGGGLEDISLLYVSRLTRRVVINRKTFSDLREQYARNGVDKKFLDKITIIENAVSVPEEFSPRKIGDRLKVLFVGRGGIEKRVHLVGEIARLCWTRDLPIDFTLVGDVIDSMPAECREYCTILGEIANSADLERYYREHDLLLVTSSNEGFPMVIMEAMAQGVVPATTDVGGIFAHVVDGITGFLITCTEPEEEITASFVELLSNLVDNRSTLKEMSEQVYRHALENFDFSRFNRAYRQLLVGNQP